MNTKITFFGRINRFDFVLTINWFKDHIDDMFDKFLVLPEIKYIQLTNLSFFKDIKQIGNYVFLNMWYLP